MIEQAKAGNKDAFRQIVEQHGRDLFKLAFRMVGNEADAEEVVQETFISAYRNLDGFDGRSSLGTWLHRIAANRAVDLLRGRQRQARVSAAPLEEVRPATTESPNPERAVISGQTRGQIQKQLEKLAPKERAAFTLRHFEELSIAEIGNALGMRQSAVKHAIFRAVRKLRDALEPI